MPAKTRSPQTATPALSRAAGRRPLVACRAPCHHAAGAFQLRAPAGEPRKDRAWNEKKFGPCATRIGHGHNYVLEVTVRGQPDAETGYVIDLAELKAILHRPSSTSGDHRNLNSDVDFLLGLNPSTENLVIAFWNEIAPLLPPAAKLHGVRLYETPATLPTTSAPTPHEADVSPQLELRPAGQDQAQLRQEIQIDARLRRSMPDMMRAAHDAIQGANVPIQQVGIHNFRLPLKYRTRPGKFSRSRRASPAPCHSRPS